MQGNKHWVGSWAAAPAPAEGVVGFNNHTIRMNPRISLGGDRLRVRISNAYGNRNRLIGAVCIALRDKGPGIVPGSDRKLTFGGSDGTVIAAGAVQFSDPVELNAPALADLAVSIHLPGEVLANFQITGRYARQTNYISPPGDFTRETVMPVGNLTDQWFFLCGVDVLASGETGGVVALGDSLTDGNISTIDAFCRWPDQLARRLAARGGRPIGVMNNGLGGNRILHDLRGDSGLRRFDRDVLSQPGVTHAIVMLGTNDLRNRWAKPEEEVTGEQMIAGLAADGGAGPQPRHQADRRDPDAVRQRDVHGQRVEPDAREAPGRGQQLDPRSRAPSTASPISTRRCATPKSRPRWRRNGIAATGCTRATPAIAIWPTRSICRCSIRKLISHEDTKNPAVQQNRSPGESRDPPRRTHEW